jgi:hemolysin III
MDASTQTLRHRPSGTGYTRAERVADGIVHMVGVVGALMAAPVIVTLAAVWHGDLPVVAAAVIYGLSMIAMFGFSASYHLVGHPRAKALLRRFDHGAIFVKIAGTYTPFAVLLGGEDAATVLIGIWTAAAVGLALVTAAPRRFEWLSLVLYLGMGWSVLVVGRPMIESMSDAGIVLVVLGGVLYTLGVVFHLWNRLPFQNAIWHAHVLAASFVFYAAVMVEVGKAAG